jgi:hypothetical protein
MNGKRHHNEVPANNTVAGSGKLIHKPDAAELPKLVAWSV